MASPTGNEQVVYRAIPVGGVTRKRLWLGPLTGKRDSRVGAILPSNGPQSLKREGTTMRINWREVFKFLSGATFAFTITNGYLCLYDISGPVPLIGLTISPRLFGARAVINAILCGVFFYFGYLRERSTSA